MADNLTRHGARTLTESLDRIATAVQHNAAVLGLPVTIAQDFAYRCDLISDAVEKTAGTNFPFREAEFDAGSIGAEVPGPLVDEPPSPQLDDHFTQDKFHELGDMEEAAEKLASMMVEADRVLEAVMPTVQVKGFAGFTDQIRRLDELSSEIELLEAELDAATKGLLTRKKDLDKEMKKAVEVLKKDYKDNLGQQGNVVIERKTALVDALARLAVVARKRTPQAVREEMLAILANEYGASIMDRIPELENTLREEKKTLAVAFKGFELEMRTASAEDKQAGVLDKLVRFREWLVGGLRRILSMGQQATRLFKGVGQKMKKDTDAFLKELDGYEKEMAKAATEEHGFDFFAE
jgi:hypothetical protein